MSIIDQLNGKKVVIWGCGNNFNKKKKYITEYVHPVFVVDNREELQNEEVLEGVPCYSPNHLASSDTDIVIISVENRFAAKQIESQIHDMNEKIEVLPLNALVDEIQIKEQETSTIFSEPKNKIMHFSCELGSCVCNLKCSYCYVDFYDPELKDNSHFHHSVDFMLKALSPQRLGAFAFFNMCGEGETLLKPGIIELVYGLLSMGHYVGLITNGTVTPKVEELIGFPNDLKKRLLVQNSLHYIELKNQNKLSVYFENVHKLREGEISVSVTMPGSDIYLNYKDEIKNVCLENLGVVPAISPIRKMEEKGIGFPNGSEYEWDKYIQTWSDFNSKAIDMRTGTLDKIQIPCYAGVSSGWINLSTGELRSCVPGEELDNIYDDINRNIKFRSSPRNCPYEYCSHSGLYLSGRTNEGKLLPTWYDMWDKIDLNGKHLIGEELRKATNYVSDY